MKRVHFSEINEVDISQILDKEGYCIIDGVLDDQKCEIGVNDIWDYLEGLESGIDRRDPTTWNYGNWPPQFYGIIKSLDIGHQKFLWDVRLDYNVKRVFATIWDEMQLHVSYDALSIMRPPEKVKCETWDNWFHFDQGVSKKEKICVQGLVNLEDVEDGDGTLVVVPRSHLHRDDFFEDYEYDENMSFCPVNSKQLEWYQDLGMEPLPLTGKKGSMFLWDSRTMHCNMAPKTDRSNPKFRYSIYVCMTPKKFSSELDIMKRRVGLKRRCLTSHWPHSVELEQNAYYLPEIYRIRNGYFRFKRPIDNLNVTTRMLDLTILNCDENPKKLTICEHLNKIYKCNECFIKHENSIDNMERSEELCTSVDSILSGGHKGTE